MRKPLCCVCPWQLYRRHLFDAFLAARFARRTASAFDYLPPTAEASGVPTDPARAVEASHSIVETPASVSN